MKITRAESLKDTENIIPITKIILSTYDIQNARIFEE